MRTTAIINSETEARGEKRSSQDDSEQGAPKAARTETAASSGDNMQEAQERNGNTDSLTSLAAIASVTMPNIIYNLPSELFENCFDTSQYPVTVSFTKVVRILMQREEAIQAARTNTTAAIVLTKTLTRRSTPGEMFLNNIPRQINRFKTHTPEELQNKDIEKHIRIELINNRSMLLISAQALIALYRKNSGFYNTHLTKDTIKYIFTTVYNYMTQLDHILVQKNQIGSVSSAAAPDYNQEPQTSSSIEIANAPYSNLAANHSAAIEFMKAALNITPELAGKISAEQALHVLKKSVHIEATRLLSGEKTRRGRPKRDLLDLMNSGGFNAKRSTDQPTNIQISKATALIVTHSSKNMSQVANRSDNVAGWRYSYHELQTSDCAKALDQLVNYMAENNDIQAKNCRIWTYARSFSMSAALQEERGRERLILIAPNSNLLKLPKAKERMETYCQEHEQELLNLGIRFLGCQSVDLDINHPQGRGLTVTQLSTSARNTQAMAVEPTASSAAVSSAIAVSTAVTSEISASAHSSAMAISPTNDRRILTLFSSRKEEVKETPTARDIASGYRFF